MKERGAEPELAWQVQLVGNLQRFVDLALRQVVSGGVFILAVGLMRIGGFSFLMVGAEPKDISGLLLLLFLMTAGSVIYSLHRALLHKPIVCGLIWHRMRVAAVRGEVRKSLGVTEPASSWDIRRHMAAWRLRQKKENENFFGHVQRWAAQVHLLYTSALGVALAALVVGSTGDQSGNAQPIAWSIAVLLLVGAVIDDGTLLYEETQEIRSPAKGTA
ncbi:MAG: hypothetical protein ACREJC_05955 [Tepidisphaeraceae bacterium]